MVKRGYGAVMGSGRPYKVVKGRSPAIASIIAAKKRSMISNRVGFGYRLPGTLLARRGEVNSLDLPVANYVLDTTGTVTCLNLIRAGATYVNRTGRRIEMKSLRINGMISPFRTSADDYVRILVVYDRQTNGANPVIADIIQTTDQAAANTTTSYSGANLNNRDRFIVLMDFRAKMPSQTYTAGVITNPGWIDQTMPQFQVERYIKLKGLVTQYKADSSPAVVGDISTGGLFMVTFGNLAAANAGFSANLETRLRFTDTH